MCAHEQAASWADPTAPGCCSPRASMGSTSSLWKRGEKGFPGRNRVSCGRAVECWAEPAEVLPFPLYLLYLHFLLVSAPGALLGTGHAGSASGSPCRQGSCPLRCDGSWLLCPLRWLLLQEGGCTGAGSVVHVLLLHLPGLEQMDGDHTGQERGAGEQGSGLGGSQTWKGMPGVPSAIGPVLSSSSPPRTPVQPPQAPASPRGSAAPPGMVTPARCNLK